MSYLINRCRRGSTLVTTVLRKSVRFLIINILLMKTLSKLKSGKWIGCFIQGEWNWPISCLNDSETQERGHERVQIQTFPGEHVRAPPLEALAFV